MKIAGKILLILAALILAGGIFTLFWKEASGEVTEYRILSRTYAGNGGMAAMGATYRSGATALTSIRYRYTVNGISYSARSIRFFGGSSTMKTSIAHYHAPIKIYHSHSFPSLSVIDRKTPFLIVFLLVLLGFGLIEMQNWFLKHTQPRKA